MKQSLNTHDIYVLILELKVLEGYRVLNVYDVDSKTICIKLNSNKTEDETKSEKKFLIIESGTKFYLMDNFSALRDTPSSFCSKLRKHLKNKRLEKISQVNQDRVIDLSFGHGDMEFHIIGEFYASGNIILTSNDYKILTLLHSHVYEPKQETEHKGEKDKGEKDKCIKTGVIVGQIYPFEFATNKLELTPSNIIHMFEENITKLDKKIKLKQFINKLQLIKFSSNVIEHSLHKLNIDLALKISPDTKWQDIFKDSEQIEKFIQEINELFKLDKFVGYKTHTNVYPYNYSHLNLKDSIRYENFTLPLSLYFQSIKPFETKEVIKKKVVQIKVSKQEKAIYNIEQQIHTMEKNICSIEKQIDLLMEHIEYIQNYINLVETQKIENYSSMNNEYFKFVEIIEYKKKIKFELEGSTIEFDYSKSVFGVREEFYSKIKKISSKLSNANILLEKQKKNLSRTNRTNVDTEKIVKLDNSQVEQLPVKYNITCVPGQSKTNWFEQFNWFFTSDNLLFISGKTAEQNELIVKRYMEDSDIYVHSETFGSGSGIIKNPLKLDVPNSNPKSLIECGCFLIAHTKAWESGVGNSAFWVRPSQVSKTPESGEYITKGSFIVRGQKNFIRVDRMELGFGIIFKVQNKDGFTGYVNKDEQIEYALPILSTYSAITSYKFKVKVVNGTQKITKALKDVISCFIAKSNLSEKEAIKKISNDSIQKVLITKIRFIPSR